LNVKTKHYVFSLLKYVLLYLNTGTIVVIMPMNYGTVKSRELQIMYHMTQPNIMETYFFTSMLPINHALAVFRIMTTMTGI